MKYRLAILACIILLGGLLLTISVAQAQTPEATATAPAEQAVDPTQETPAQEGPTLEAPTQEGPVLGGPVLEGFDAEAASAELAGLLESTLQNRVDSLAPLIYDVVIDHIVYSSDGQVAALWVAMLDPQTGEALATEPSLVIAKRSSLDAAWSLTLPPEADYAAALAALPDEVITPELRKTFLAQVPDEADLAPDAVQAGAVFSGYRLPWAGGQSKHLSGSIGHYLVYNPPSCSEYYCRYAFDFAGRNTDTTTTLDTRFPLLAAKGGEVYAFYDGCATGNSNCTNYMVLKDSSTNPVTYQTYLHLDYNSIPAELKVKGKQVLQGQWIGNVDDTGYSTGDHVHFHVYATPTGTYWGPSVDITFDDVDINGGRPRTCYEANNWPSLGNQCHAGGDEFVSGNFGAYPPTAALTLPGAGEVISDGNLLVAGQAWDNVGVMKAQAILKINGEWQLAGPAQVLGGATYESYVLDVDLCDSDAAAGPLEVAVRVWDYEGNASIDPQSARTVTNRTFCIPPPPACQPTANQVALYSGPNYTGSCKVLGAGSYTSASAFYPVPDDSLSSLLVGSNVQALLFEQGGLTERTETIAWNDPNLADNRLGDNMMSSLQVAARTLAIGAPTLYTPFNVTTAAVTSADSLVLDWAAPGAVSFQSTLSGPLSLSRDWTDSNGWSVGSLPAGDYTWTVNARSANGAVAPASRNFTVAAASLPGASPLGVPASQMEDAAGWATTAAGLWHFETNYELGGRTLNGWVYNQDGDYGSSTVGASDLTSPPISVPAGGWLAFDYNTLTESANAYWDQRWVQISVDGGRFVNLLQLSGERMDAWLASPWINLSAYAGKSVRLRFHFDIVDKYFNGEVRGWVIDNVRVFTGGLPACAESSNETAASATVLGTATALQGSICPAGDLDFYRIHVLAEQRVTATLQANGAALELALLAADGRSLLQSSATSVGLYALSTGDYYLRVRAVDHPGVGSAADSYNLTVETVAPVSQMLPLPATTNSTAVLLQWSAADAGYGLSRFELQIDVGNSGNWQVLDAAVPGSSRGYWYIGQPNTTYAFRMRAFDQGGNAELFPAGAEAVTRLAAGCSGDGYEDGDDSPAGAAALVQGVDGGQRNLCGSNDADWIKFSAQAGQKLVVAARWPSGGAAMKMRLYAQNNLTTPLATVQSSGLGVGAYLFWRAPASGDYWVRIDPLRADLYGTDAKYTLWVGEQKTLFLPLVGKN